MGKPLPSHDDPDFHPGDIKEVIFRAIDRANISPQSREILKANAAASTLARHDAPMFLDLREGSCTDRAEGVPNGPLDVRAQHLDRVYGNYLGEFLFWVTDGRVDCIEYAWITDDPPIVWPHATAISFERTDWPTAELTVEIYPEFRENPRRTGFYAGGRSALLRFHQGYIGAVILAIHPIPGHTHCRVRVGFWNDIARTMVRRDALFVLWCGGDFGRGQVLEGTQL